MKVFCSELINIPFSICICLFYNAQILTHTKAIEQQLPYKRPLT
jgi:hypothetical protein